MSASEMPEFDVAIVGGGLVGASLAVALSGSGRRVALIERAAPPVSAPAWDERCIALNDTSRRIFSSLGVWPELAAAGCAITETHISEQGRFGVARFTAAEAGLDALGYNVPLRAIGRTLWEKLPRDSVTLCCPATVTALRPDAGAVELALRHTDGARTSALRARLVAAADGADSGVRAFFGVPAQRRDYHQHAIVSAVRIGRAQRGVAYERFTPDGPMAVLPKGEAACSLVWTVPNDRVEAMLQWPDAPYLDAARKTFGGRLGPFLALGRRNAWPLSRVMSARLTAPRTVFLGNAAQSLHPVAAQGFNLGLRDVATLAQALAGADDPGAAPLLEDYAERRRRDRLAVSELTDVLVRTFSNRIPGLMQGRHWGLLGLELLPMTRDRILKQHLGRLGMPVSM